jgi:hypothetical protein
LCALIIGLTFSAWIVVKGPRQSPSLLSDFFLGTIDNPRTVVVRRILDVKMYLYLVGAVHLELNLLSYAAAHSQSFRDPNPGVALSAALLSWFVAEYLWWENVHLYTYDFFAEKVGVKLGFGCRKHLFGYDLYPFKNKHTPSLAYTAKTLRAVAFQPGCGRIVDPFLPQFV